MDNNNKMSEEEKREKETGFNLDGILSELGSFGKYQLLLLLLLAFRDSFLNMCNFHYVFTAEDVAYRCRVPECEHFNTSVFNTTWGDFTNSNTSGICQRAAPRDNHWDHTALDHCSADNFHKDELISCQDIIYENYNSIAAEFDLGCQPWKRTLIGTIHNLGLIFSFIILGFVSDKYGRKVVIVGTPLMVGVAGLIKSYSLNYWMLLVLEFLESSLGYGNASLVLTLEAVNQNNRVVYSCISDSLSSLGAAFFSLIAWKVPYWRHMMRAIYAPLLVVVFYIFLVDEGVRWLLAHNKKDEAVRILHKVAKINNVTLSNKAQDMLTNITEKKNKADKETKKKKPEMLSTIFSDLKSKTILMRVALIAACFFCSAFVYSGAIVNSTSVSGNKYLNYSAMMLVSIPMRILTALTLNRFGRKAPICVAYCLCAVFFVTSAFVPKSISWASILFYVAGKMGSSYGFFALFVVAVEVFPTTSRNSLINLSNTIGRLGSVLAPQAPLLEKYMHGLPSITFGLVALGACLLSLLLPDTTRVSLPDDVLSVETHEQLERDKQHQEQNADACAV